MGRLYLSCCSLTRWAGSSPTQCGNPRTSCALGRLRSLGLAVSTLPLQEAGHFQKGRLVPAGIRRHRRSEDECGGRRRQAEANSTVPPKTVIRQLLIFPLKLRPSTLIATALTDAAEQEEKMPGTVLAWCSLRPPGEMLHNLVYFCVIG